MGNFTGEISLSGSGNLRSAFNHSNLFQSEKQHSVNNEHRLKSKLAWPVYAKSMKLKMVQEQWLLLKIKFLLACNVKNVI